MVNLAPITVADDRLQEAIERKAAQLCTGIPILRLVNQHSPTGRGECYRNIPQALRPQFLANLQALGPAT